MTASALLHPIALFEENSSVNESEQFVTTVDRSLQWVARAVADDNVDESVAFFGLDCHEQFLAIEELRTLARLAIDLAGVDPGVFLSLATQGLRDWLVSPLGPCSP